MKVNPILKPDERIPKLALRPFEAADALGVCEKTLRSWAKAGKIPHVREGNNILFPVHVLRQWLTQRSKQTLTAALPAVSEDTSPTDQ